MNIFRWLFSHLDEVQLIILICDTLVSLVELLLKISCLPMVF